MTHGKTTALVVAMALFPTIAIAQDRGSEQDQEACTPDVFRLCGDYIPNEGPILACLQTKRSQLSPACGVVIFPPSAAADPAEGQATTARPHAGHGKHKKKRHALGRSLS